MKKNICLFFILCFFLFSGCSFPSRNSTDDSGFPAQSFENTVSGADLTNAETTNNDGKSITNESSKTIDNQRSIILYYQDQQGTLIPVTRRVSKEEALASLAINGLIDSAMNREELEYYGLYPILPKGTEILGINLKEGNATIEFNDKLLDYSSQIAENSIITAIVYTLTEFSTIDKVKIWIKGNSTSKLKFGTDISEYLSRENVLINSSRVNTKLGLRKFDGFLFKNINEKFTYILPVSIELSEMNVDKTIEKMVNSLANEKQNKGLYTQLPAKSGLLRGEIKGDVLTLDFNKEFSNYGGNAREDGILKQILYSAKQFKGINRIKLFVEGNDTYLLEGTDISKEILIPKGINDFIDKV